MKKNVFVVGAGASCDFGLPTGEGLISRISQICSKPHRGGPLGQVAENLESEIASVFHNTFNHPIQVIETFSRIKSSIWLSSSIDNYINDLRDERLLVAGKVLISASILYGERHQIIEGRRYNNPLWIKSSKSKNIDYSSIRESWLVHWFRGIRSQRTFQDFRDALCHHTYIIFNYDRCFEHFLFNALCVYDGLRPSEAAELVSEMDILHPYGKIADLPWESSEKAVGFGDLGNLETAIIESKSIQTFMEAKDKSITKRISHSIRDSENVVFLGFGFAEQNIELFGDPELFRNPSKPRRQVFATTFGLTRHKAGIAKTSVAPFLKTHPNPGTDVDFATPSRVQTIPSTAGELLAEFRDELFH